MSTTNWNTCACCGIAYRSGTASSGVAPPAIDPSGTASSSVAPPAIEPSGIEPSGTASSGTASSGTASSGVAPPAIEPSGAASSGAASFGTASSGTASYSVAPPAIEPSGITTVHPLIAAVIANPSSHNMGAALNVANDSLDRALADAASDDAHFLDNMLKAFSDVYQRSTPCFSARDVAVLVARVLHACKGRPDTPLLSSALQLTFNIVHELVLDLETSGPVLVDDICGAVVGILGECARLRVCANAASWACCVATKFCDIAGIRRMCVAAGGIRAVCALPAHRTRAELLAGLLTDADADACAEVVACGGLDVLQQSIRLWTGPLNQRLTCAMYLIASTATARCRVIEAEAATWAFENANLRQSDAVAKARVEQYERAEWEGWVVKTKHEIAEIASLGKGLKFGNDSADAVAKTCKALVDIAAKDEARAGMDQARGAEMDAIVHLAAVGITVTFSFSVTSHVEAAHAHSMLDAVTSLLERRASAGAAKSDDTMDVLTIMLYWLSYIHSVIRAANDAHLARGLAACAAVMDARKDAPGPVLSSSIVAATNFLKADRSRDQHGLPFEDAGCLLDSALYILHRYSGWPGGLPARAYTLGYVCCLINSLGSRSDAMVQSRCVASGALEDIAKLLQRWNGATTLDATDIKGVENALAVAVHLMAADDGRARAFANVGGARAADSVAQANGSLSESAKKDVLHIVRICAAAESSAALRKAEERATEVQERATEVQERAAEAEERAAKAEERAAEAEERAAKAKQWAEEVVAERNRVIAAVHRLVYAVPAGAGGTKSQDLPAGEFSSGAVAAARL